MATCRPCPRERICLARRRASFIYRGCPRRATCASPAPPHQTSACSVGDRGGLTIRSARHSILQREHDNPLAGLGTDVGVQAAYRDTEHILNDALEGRPVVIEQLLPHLLEQGPALPIIGLHQLDLG